MHLPPKSASSSTYALKNKNRIKKIKRVTTTMWHRYIEKQVKTKEKKKGGKKSLACDLYKKGRRSHGVLEVETINQLLARAHTIPWVIGLCPCDRPFFLSLVLSLIL